MATLRELIRRLWGTIRQTPHDHELEEELRMHLEFAADEARRRGSSPEDAVRAARVQFGGVAQAMEEMRDQRGLPWLDVLARDVRLGLRSLRRTPAYTAIALLTLALGIGANTAIFSLTNAVLLRPLPFTDSERLVMVWEDASFAGFPRNTPSAATYADIKTQSHTLEDLAALDNRSFNLTGDGEPERVEAYGVTASFSPLLGIRPVLGRSFTAEEDSPDGSKAVMLSYGLWQNRYGGDRSIVGRNLLLTGEKYTVVGVLPADFEFLRKDIGMLVPIAFTKGQLDNRGRHYLTVVGRMKAGVTVAETQADTQAILIRAAQEHPGVALPNSKYGAAVLALREQIAGDVRRQLTVLLAAVGFVLLIACANVANLLLARAAKGRKEIAVRTALGAGRARIVAQSLTESMLLALTGSAVGLLFARWSFSFLQRMVPEGMSMSTHLELDWRILGFTLLVTLLTGFIFGSAPAVQTTRVELNELLKQSGGRSAAQSHTRFRNALVITQVALAMLLLVGAGLLIQTFLNLRAQYTGLRPQHVLTVRTQIPDPKYRELPARVGFYDQVLARVKSLPGVVSTAYTTSVPLAMKGGTSQFTPEGRQPEPVAYDANFRQVSEQYFQTIGIEVVQGRNFVASDDVQAVRVAIVNQTMARQYWPGVDAIGKRFKVGGPNSPAPWTTIVGIAADVRQMGTDAPVKAEMYFPYRQLAAYAVYRPRDLVIRASVEPGSLAAAVRSEIHAVDPNQPISDIRTMDNILDDETATRRSGMTLLATFAGLALLLSMLGIYGVLSYFVAQHTQQIGVQMALGAQAGNILRLVFKKGMVLVLAGLALGVISSFALTRLMQSVLYEVSAADPLTFAGVAALLLAVALLACYLPARRAMKVDPITALRYE